MNIKLDVNGKELNVVIRFYKEMSRWYTGDEMVETKRIEARLAHHEPIMMDCQFNSVSEDDRNDFIDKLPSVIKGLYNEADDLLAGKGIINIGWADIE